MKRDELPIASPCHVDFASMSPVEALKSKGRFCGDCKKVVHDLSTMSEREARALLAAPKSEGLCVRYLHDEVGTIVFLRELGLVAPSRLARFKRAAVAGALLAAPLALTACMGAAEAPRPPASPVTVEPANPPPVEIVSDGGAPANPQVVTVPTTSESDR